MDIRSLQRIREVLLSHRSGMLPSFKPLVPFIDIVQVSVEMKLEFRKWNISVCAAYNSSQDDLSFVSVLVVCFEKYHNRHSCFRAC